ncbi:AbfB domain-containing protein [Streptomyces sp. R28]|uniref:AbfB domain-containing protein n=1 Tax=Streptomyces sp. R28 TaxID=3238628 RepID=A0AB39PPF4_9ACTN
MPPRRLSLRPLHGFAVEARARLGRRLGRVLPVGERPDPTRYPRHHDHNLRLDAIDGTIAFDQDATFHRTAGLADPAWSSLRSYTFPDRHVLHSDHGLRVDPISMEAERANATFCVGH